MLIIDLENITGKVKNIVELVDEDEISLIVLHQQQLRKILMTTEKYC